MQPYSAASISSHPLSRRKPGANSCARLFEPAGLQLEPSLRDCVQNSIAMC